MHHFNVACPQTKSSVSGDSFVVLYPMIFFSPFLNIRLLHTH